MWRRIAAATAACVAGGQQLDELDVRLRVLAQLVRRERGIGGAQEALDAPAQAARDLEQQLVVGELPERLVEAHVELADASSSSRARRPSPSRRASRMSSASADGVQRSSTRSQTNCSSTTRTLEISSSERGESSATRAPRRGRRTTSPSSASRASASRTGMWLVPSSRAIARSTSRAPGA